MGLKSGLYFMVFAKYEEDEEEHYADDDDYYTKWCLGGVHVGKIPGGLHQSYFTALFARFSARYGWEQRPFRMSFYYHNDVNPDYPKNLTEEVLLDLVLKYGIMFPEHREVLDIAVDVVNGMRKVVVESDKPTSQSGGKPRAEKKGDRKIGRAHV
jgi:hypothetical protein